MKFLYKLLFVITLFNYISITAQDLSFYQADTTTSVIRWKCDKHNGEIKFLKGGFVVEGDSIAGGLFVINMKSIKNLDMDPKQFGTAIMILENTLKNEFFEVEKYPVAVFELLEIQYLQENKYLLTGDFTLHGHTICLSFKATIQKNGDKLVLESEKFTIDRTDWGVYRMSPKRPYADDENDWTVPDEIELQILLTTIKNQS